jgi:carboxylesterase type B
MLLDPNSTGSKMFNSIDFMTGSNDGEGGLLYFNLISEQSNFNFDLKRGIPSRVVCDHIAPTVSRDVLGVEGCDNVTRAICNEYSSVGASISLKQETSLAINLFGDMEMSSTAEQALYFHSRSQKKSYQYLFTHKPTWGLISERPSWLLGANHADELAFIFGLKRWYPKDVNISSAESKLSSRMMSYWLNFGKTG